MRLYVFTLTRACLFLLLCPPVTGRLLLGGSVAMLKRPFRTKTP